MSWIYLSKYANVPTKGEQSSEWCTASSTGISPSVYALRAQHALTSTVDQQQTV